MDRNDFDVDYDLGAEQNIDPDQFPYEPEDDDLDIESLKKLIGDDSTEPQAAPAEGTPSYEESGYRYPDSFDDVDLDDPLTAANGGYEQEAYAEDADEAYAGDPQEAYSEEGYAEEGYSEEGYAEGDNPEEGYAEEGYSEEGYAEGDYPEEGYAEEGYSEEGYAEEGYSEEDYAEEDYAEEDYAEEDYPEGEDPADAYQEEEYRAGYPEQPYTEEANSQGEYAEGEYPDDGEYPAEELPAEEYPQEKPQKPKKEKKPRKPMKKPSMPPFFKNLMGIYFGAAIAEATGMNNQEGRRRRSKARIFKDSYLPLIILLVAFVLTLTCIIGSVSRLFQQKMRDDEEARQESIAASEEEDRLQGEYVDLMHEAEMAAQAYDFEGAIQILDRYSGEAPQEMVTKRAEYVTMSTKMTEWKDPTGIPNLSFHCLVADPARAYADKGLGGKYNMNFVTTDEFQRILESLYANNYVLVDFDSFVEISEPLDDGQETFSIKPILLPEDKKPVMITETLVSYYDYMVDSNKDGKPDAGGAGFAHRLLVDEFGEIKAEYIDKDGNVLVGDYDLVPILETFLHQHPDFSYRGSRAILAPTGEQGIFGYRVQTSVISDPKLGQEYYNQQVQGAKELCQALRDKGYTLASYTYGNKSYGQNNANQIAEDLASWDTQITPVMGNTNVMVFAQGSDIGDYTGTKFKALYDKGFRFFVGQSDKPFVDVSNTYVRQKRLMVTGSNMFWNGKMFSGMFDTAAVLNSMRGDVPKAK